MCAHTPASVVVPSVIGIISIIIISSIIILIIIIGIIIIVIIIIVIVVIIVIIVIITTGMFLAFEPSLDIYDTITACSLLPPSPLQLRPSPSPFSRFASVHPDFSSLNTRSHSSVARARLVGGHAFLWRSPACKSSPWLSQ